MSDVSNGPSGLALPEIATGSAWTLALTLALATPTSGQTEERSGRSRGSTQDEDASGESTDLFERARASLEQGHHREAERLYRDLIDRQPYQIEGYQGLARALGNQGRRLEAGTVLTELGEGLLQAGEAGLAEQVLREALGLYPGSAEAHALLGRSLLRENAFQDAAASLQRARELGATDLTTTFYLAAAWWESGNMSDVEALYKDAVAVSDGDWVALHQLGGLYLWQGRYREALEPLEQASRKRPPPPDLLLDVGRAQEGAGQPESALASYRRVVDLAPELPQAHYQLGLLLSRLGHDEEAADALGHFRRLHAQEQTRLREQKRGKALVDEGWYLMRKGDFGAAERQFRSLPETSETLEGVAAALSAGGDHRGAVEALKRAVVLAPDRRDLKLRLARERVAAEKR